MAEPLLVNFEELPYHLRAGSPEPPEPDKIVSWGDSWDASWTTESSGQALFNLATEEVMPAATPEDEEAYYMQQYNPHDDVKNRYPDLASDFLFDYFDENKNPSQVDFTAKWLAKEINAKQTQMNAPFWQQLITDIGASAAGSPATYGEVAFMASPWGRAGKLGLTAGRGARRALQTGGAVAGITGIEEFLLNKDQEFRTGVESAVAIGGSLFLGSALGYATGAREIKLNSDLSATVTDSGGAIGAHGNGSTAGAAEVLQDISTADYHAIMDSPDLTSAQKTLKVMEEQAKNYQIVSGLGVGRGAVKLGALLRINPETTLAATDNPVLLRLGAFIGNSPYLRKGHQTADNQFVDIDTMATRADTRIEEGVDKIFTSNYKAYKKSGMADQNIQSEMDFNRQVQIAGSRGDKHSNPHVQKASQDLRAEFTAEIGRRGVRHNLLKGDANGNPVAPLGDSSWYLRSWSRNYAGRVTPEDFADGLMGPYMKRLRKTAGDEKVEIEAQVTKLKEDVEGLRRGYDAYAKGVEGKTPDTFTVWKGKQVAKLRRKNPKGRELKKLDADDTSQRAKFMKMRDDVMNGSNNADAHEFSGLGLKVEADGTYAMSKGRTVDIATEDLPIDYLDPDPKLSIINALKRTERQLLMYEDPRFGDPAMRNWMKELKRYHDAKLEEAGGDVKKTRKLEKDYRKAQRMVTDLTKQYYGIRPGTPSETTAMVMANLKSFTALTGLGSVLITTLPELASALSHQGFQGYVRHVSSRILDPKAMAKLSRVEKAELDIGIQGAMGMRWMEVGEYAGDMGKYSKMLHMTADKAVDKVYMLGRWTRAMSTEVGIMTQSKLARIVVKENLSKRDLSDLGLMGIHRDMVPDIRAQVEAHGKKLRGGAWDAGLDKWDNQAILRHVGNAINAEVNNIIIRPGVGATPFIGRTMAGSVALQFKQFLLAATSKYLIADVQRAFAGDFRAIERQMALAAMGYMSISLKSNFLYGESAKKNWDKKSQEERIIEGAIQGGGGGLAFDLINLGVESMYPGTSQRYYGNRTAMNMLLGPNVGKVEDALNFFGIAGAMTSPDHDLMKKHTDSIVRNVPGASFWPVRLGWPTLKEDVYELVK